MLDYASLREAMKKGNVVEVTRLIDLLLAEGATAENILNQGLLEAMSDIGQRFKRGELFVPSVLIAARAMKKGTEMLKPLLVKAGAQPVATAVIGTVKGDLHDIGKNLVCMMIEGAGFAVIDAGVDVSAEKFVELARQHNAQIIGVSALLTTTMPGMKSVVEAVRGAGLGAKVIIGGAPVTQAFCDSIGADGYSADAASAAELARSLIA
jgi:5-methyltetrahydrofolate--homocysteine methyltransferase